MSERAHKDSRIRKKVIAIFKVVASLVFIFLVISYFFGKNTEALKRDLFKVEYQYVFLSMIFGGWAYINRGLRWIVLIDALNYKSSKLNSIASVSIGYLTNLFIPRGGEISRCTSLSQAEKIPVDKLFGTILIERVIDFIFLIFFCLLTVLFKSSEILKSYREYQKLPDESSDYYFEYIIIFIVGISMFLLFYYKKRIKQTKWYKKMIEFLIGIKEGFRSIKKMKKQSSFWFHTFSIWIMYFLMTYICLFSIPETSSLTFSDALFLLAIGGIGMVIPTPGGIGSYHIITMIGLVALGVQNGFISIDPYDKYNPAMLFPTIVWFGQTFVAIILGSISILLLFLSKKKKKNESFGELEK